MNPLPPELQQILSQPVPEQAWQQLLAWLEQHPYKEFDAIEQGLSQWGYITVLRQPLVSAWQQLQTGGGIPCWWPLVRHINIARYDTVDHLPTDNITSVRIADDVDDIEDLITCFPSLITLDATGCDIDCDALVNISTLQKLILRRARPTQIYSLAKLPSLKMLDISESAITLECLKPMPCLKELDVSGTVVESLESLLLFTGLEVFVAEYCSGKPDVNVLSQCVALKRVLLAGTSVDIENAGDDIKDKIFLNQPGQR